ncbi:hypothetical protein DPEC_G00121880 [Dallia pectoralis]|uniref:Uncharacterized protein n=1 Tax=Dallia pectoralis TaxID=75939 RepID=A0ACC2GQC1_DALPE|nr:hypothetical protein DPEC_G00121880 [Dallia pectoralis]
MNHQRREQRSVKGGEGRRRERRGDTQGSVTQAGNTRLTRRSHGGVREKGPVGWDGMALAWGTQVASLEPPHSFRN